MSERYKREIEEILDNIEELPLHRPRPQKRSLTRAMLAAVGQFLGGRGWTLTPGRIMLGSLVLLLVALLFKASMPGLVVPILVWAAVVVFIVGYALFFINPHASYEKRWRGQVIERSLGWWERFLRLVRGR